MKHRKKMENFLSADIYGITADEYSLGRGNVETVRLMVEAGIKVVQYREKNKKSGEMYRECLAIRQITCDNKVTFIVNDHIDLALAVGADGVHIGQDDLPPQIVRDIIGDEMIIGLSTHSPTQARKAQSLAGIIDYIGAGPIFATKTKKDVCEPVGLEYLEYVSENINIPFVSIGGIKEHNVASVKKHGAKIIAMVTEIVHSVDIQDKVKRIRTQIYN